ncbi:MAG: DUF805 domain-containing protein [Burkholderiales bacterium]|nr:DUF805 domain-containing protein [Burkholderiales bacterium]
MKHSSLAKADFSSQFEMLMAEAKATANFVPLWRGFVRTNFLVAIVWRTDDRDNDFDLVSMPTEHHINNILIAELKENLSYVDNVEVISITGAEIVRLVPDGVGISIAMRESTFDLPAARVVWLRKSLEASQDALRKKTEQARVEKREANDQKENDVAPESSLVARLATSVQASVTKPGDDELHRSDFHYQEFQMPVSSPEKKEKVSFNVATIRKKHVTHSGLGIELMMPENWQEARNDKALKLFETHSGITAEINGRRRDDMSLESWMDARLALVTQQLPGLAKVGGSHDLKGSNWPASMRAQFCEFSGRINGDDEDSHYLLCCFETEKRLLVVGILAKQAIFAAQRSLLIWMLESVGSFELRSTQKSAATSSSSQSDTVHETVHKTRHAPSLLSISFTGRIGRARLMVYSLLWVLPFTLFVLIGMLGLKALNLGEGIYPAVVLTLAVVMQVRPYILRLHDLNLGGKWLFIYSILLFLPSLAPRSGVAALTLLVAVAGILILFFFPGSAEENDYGSPNPPNSIAMKLGAVFCGIFMIVGSVNYYKTMRGQGAGLFDKSAASETTGIGFTPADKSFIIDFPIAPIESDLSSAQSKRSGISEVKTYTSDWGRFHYLVQRMTVSISPEDKSLAMDAMAESFAKNISGEVLDRSMERINGLVARAMRFRLRNGDYQDFRFLLVRDHLFVLAVQSNSASGKEPEILNFFESFEVH